MTVRTPTAAQRVPGSDGLATRARPIGFLCVQTVQGLLKRSARVAETTRERLRQAPVTTDEGHLNCVVIIDVSLSMQETDYPPSRLDAAKEAADAYAGRLLEQAPTSRVAIVSYSDSAKTVCPLTPVYKRSSISDAINDLSTISHTNITAGVEAALELLSSQRGRNQVVLLSDGCHNEGSPPQPTASALRERAVVECIGIGQRGDVDEELLREIASANRDGSKRYRWIGDPEGLVEHFEDLAGRISRE